MRPNILRRALSIEVEAKCREMRHREKVRLAYEAQLEHERNRRRQLLMELFSWPELGGRKSKTK